MKVQILGTGCPKCHKLAELAGSAIQDLGVDAEVVKVTDINEIMEFNVMVTPALAVDGDVKSAGRLPSVDEIKGWLGAGGS
ncbi:MAG: thioredoxin family protein [Planctomycetota bacterium]|jgi:small redox-active disulfide protein 2